jgi:fructosamine-3-kinase
LKSQIALNIHSATPLDGGSINQAACLKTDRGSFFIKWNTDPRPQMFAREAEGLQLIRSAQVIRVPAVYAYQDPSPDGCPGYLLLEWIEKAASSNLTMEKLGQNLALLHRSSSENHCFGLKQDNFIGSTPQINIWNQDWVVFFRDHRLGFQIQLAAKKGLMPPARRSKLDIMMGRLDRWIPSRRPTPSLVHGDLWSGNFLQAQNGDPVLVDPAVYYADREVDIAFSELFGGFPTVFYSAYKQAWPMSPGYTERRDLYNLYHLLNHLNLFGETYGSIIDATLKHYVG